MADPVTNTMDMKKNLTYDDKVIKKIAGIATDDIPGILTLSGGLIGNLADRFRSTDNKTKGIDAEVGTKQTALDLNVVCEYGKNIPDLFNTVVEKVSAAIKAMTGLEVIEVNMHVEDVMSREDFQKTQASQGSVAEGFNRATSSESSRVQ